MPSAYLKPDKAVMPCHILRQSAGREAAMENSKLAVVYCKLFSGSPLRRPSVYIYHGYVGICLQAEEASRQPV
jgi:hypothetical protein